MRKGNRKGIGAASDAKSVASDVSCTGDPVEPAVGDAAPDATGAAQGTGDDGGAHAGDRVQVLVWDPMEWQELRALPRIHAKQPMLWAPRVLRDRLCARWRGLMQDAAQAQDAECANLLFSTLRSCCFEPRWGLQKIVARQDARLGGMPMVMPWLNG